MAKDDYDDEPRGGGSAPKFNKDEVRSKKMVAGILAILLGGYGVHRFYLGDTKGGIIRILACCGGFGIIGLIEGVIYLTKSEEDFHQMYIVEKKAWF